MGATDESARRGGSHRRGALAVACLAVAVYINALDNPFIYDDYVTVLDNRSIAEPVNLSWVLSYTPFRPVVNASYLIDRLVWGYRPFGFHLTNVVLHATAAVLLYLLLLRALADVQFRTRTESSASISQTWAAFTGAALFAVHPLMTEAAGYISGRSELLCGVFVMAAVLCARRAMLPRPDGVRAPTAAVCAVAWGVAALLSKEVAAALPVVLLAYDALILPGTPEARRRRLTRVFVPVLLLVGAGAGFRLRAIAGLDVSLAAPGMSLLTQSIVVWRYVGLLALPIGQSIMHAVRAVATPGDPVALVAVGGLLAVVALAYRVRRVAPLVTFGIVWFLAVIAPSSSVIALREGMAEHRAYLASAGGFMVVASVVACAFSHGAARVRWAATVTIALVIGVMSTLTVRRNALWESPVAVWRRATVTASGMWEPHYSLADALREAGDCRSAIEAYGRALELAPANRDASINLGICLAEVGRLDEAEARFQRIVEEHPTFARGYTNLAALAQLRGNAELARDYYLRAVAADPTAIHARMQLARLYETTFRDYDAAMRLCIEVRALAAYTVGVGDCIERNRRLLEGKTPDR